MEHDVVKAKTLNLTSLILQIDFHYITSIRNMFNDFTFQPRLSERDQIFPYTQINLKNWTKYIKPWYSKPSTSSNEGEWSWAMRNKQGGFSVCHGSSLKRPPGCRVERSRDRVQLSHGVEGCSCSLGQHGGQTVAQGGSLGGVHGPLELFSWELINALLVGK